MSTLWIVLAVQLSLPIAVGLPLPDVRAVFSADDMPAYVQQAGVTRFVQTRTTVAADGTPQDCGAEKGSGDPKLDAYTCAIILNRAKFQPARWVDGSPVYAVLRVPVTWAIGAEPSKTENEQAYPADMEVSVSRLPEGAGERTSLSLMIAVDETGRLVSCGQALPTSSHFHAKVFPELVHIACQQLTAQFTAIPARDAKGKPVRSVQTATVTFNSGK